MPRTQKSLRLYICYMEECLLLNAPQSSHLFFSFAQLRVNFARFRVNFSQFHLIFAQFRIMQSSAY